MRARGRRPAAILAALLIAGPAGAQDYGGFARRAAPGDFDFYVLALSWSPTYCAAEGRRRDDVQCAPGRGLGFVLHGLWPQYARGYPESCDSLVRQPTRDALAVAGQVYPSEGLARYEWRRHGTCSGLDPTAYFTAARDARLAVTIPDALKGGGPERRLAPIDIARAFVSTNRGLRPDMMAVTCARGQLQEVRICFSKDVRGFAACPEVARANCREPEIALDAAR